MADNNGILEEIYTALDSANTPAWARPILRCLASDHIMLSQHLSWHHRLATALERVVVAVISALAVALTMWLLSGRLPGVFRP